MQKTATSAHGEPDRASRQATIDHRVHCASGLIIEVIGSCRLATSLMQIAKSRNAGGLAGKHVVIAPAGHDAQRVQLTLRDQSASVAIMMPLGGTFHNPGGDVDVDAEPVEWPAMRAGRCGCTDSRCIAALQATSQHLGRRAHRSDGRIAEHRHDPVAQPFDDVPPPASGGIRQPRPPAAA